jgi:hypothetical protein
MHRRPRSAERLRMYDILVLGLGVIGILLMIPYAALLDRI